MSEHYFTVFPAVEAEERTHRFSIRGVEHTVVTASGVFSADRLDKGTQVLLDHVPDPPETGSFLDLGCGWGPITLALADVPLEYAGAAGGILQTGERIGASIGIAVITGLTFRVSHSSGWETAAQAGLLAVVATIAVAAGVAVIDLRLARRRRRWSGGSRPGTARRRVSRAGGALAGP